MYVIWFQKKANVEVDKHAELSGVQAYENQHEWTKKVWIDAVKQVCVWRLSSKLPQCEILSSLELDDVC